MSKIFIIALVLITSNHCCYSQVDSLIAKDSFKIDTIKIVKNFMEHTEVNLIFDKTYYKKKSVSFKKTGNIFLISGIELMTGGLLIGSQLIHNYDGVAVAAIGIFFGTISCLISVPFYISSNHNRNLVKRLP